jgi:hypothetical protein
VEAVCVGSRALVDPSRNARKDNKKAKARVVECSEGEDSTRALAGLLAQRMTIVDIHPGKTWQSQPAFRKANNLALPQTRRDIRGELS